MPFIVQASRAGEWALLKDSCVFDSTQKADLGRVASWGEWDGKLGGSCEAGKERKPPQTFPVAPGVTHILMFVSWMLCFTFPTGIINDGCISY